MLSEFGKFPAFEENWKPSDFNKTKVLIFIEEARNDNNIIFTPNTIKDMLHFELRLSRDLITEILEDYKQFTDSNKIRYTNCFEYKIGLDGTTIRYVDYEF